MSASFPGPRSPFVITKDPCGTDFIERRKKESKQRTKKISMNNTTILQFLMFCGRKLPVLCCFAPVRESQCYISERKRTDFHLLVGHQTGTSRAFGEFLLNFFHDNVDLIYYMWRTVCSSQQIPTFAEDQSCMGVAHLLILIFFMNHLSAFWRTLTWERYFLLLLRKFFFVLSRNGRTSTWCGTRRNLGESAP